MKTQIILLALLLTACGEQRSITDMCVKQQIFEKCMAQVPQGPQTITAASNDWAEVITECRSASYYNAQRLRENVPKECRAE